MAPLTIATVIVGTVSSAVARAEQPPACDRPPIKLNRYDEDYAFLSDPECRTNFWDPMKYIVLARKPWTYLSLGADLRERFEYFHNRDWGRGPNDAYLLHRFMVHGDLHLGGRARGFVQLTSNFAIDRAGGPGPVDALGRLCLRSDDHRRSRPGCLLFWVRSPRRGLRSRQRA